MLSFDSMKLEANLLPCIESLNLKHERVTKITNETLGFQEVIYRVNCKDILGLKSIVIKPEKESFIVELSGKILKRDYSKLINQNTAIQALNGINIDGCIKVRPLKLIENASIHSIDCTKDLDLEGAYRIPDVIDVLSVLRNRSYLISQYPNEGIAITKVARSNNKRLIFYNKGLEILTDKELLQVININDFDGKLRSELNLRKHLFIRDEFQANHKGIVTFQEALEAKTNPNYKYWMEFRDPVPYLFQEYDEDQALSSIIKLEGIKGIIFKLSFDEDLIIKFLKRHVKHSENAYRTWKKDFKPVMESMNNAINPKYNEILELITKQLQS